MLAFDKFGISRLEYEGYGGVAGGGFKVAGGAFFYNGFKDGLVGWGGEVGSELFIGSGGSLNYFATSGESGGSVAGGRGGEFSLIHGFVSNTTETWRYDFLR